MDSMDIVKLIKKAAVEAVNASKPANVVFGKVISVSPLKIQVEQKLILSSAQLVVSEHLTDHEVDMTLDSITGRKTVTIHSGLKVGDKVIMLQKSGGQKYIVIDRIGGAT